jgi:hypothetical protein
MGIAVRGVPSMEGSTRGACMARCCYEADPAVPAGLRWSAPIRAKRYSLAGAAGRSWQAKVVARRSMRPTDAAATRRMEAMNGGRALGASTNRSTKSQRSLQTVRRWVRVRTCEGERGSC